MFLQVAGAGRERRRPVQATGTPVVRTTVITSEELVLAFEFLPSHSLRNNVLELSEDRISVAVEEKIRRRPSRPGSESSLTYE